jgi:hypothetical protein
MGVQSTYSQIYNTYFSNPEGVQNRPIDNWEGLKTRPGDFMGPISGKPVDFAVNEQKCWRDTAKRIGWILLKIVLFPWGLYELARYIVQRCIMAALYPAQSRIARFFLEAFTGIPFSPDKLDIMRRQFAIDNGYNYIVREVILEKNGVRYSGMMIGHRNTIGNGRWVIQTLGNAECMEHNPGMYAEIYHGQNYNVLVLNGPHVGRSEGTATPKTMGDAVDIGFTFLETAVKAKKIVMAGRSLGGAAIGQGILQHEFKIDKGIKYLSVSQMSFDSASSVCAKVVTATSKKESRIAHLLRRVIEALVIWSGCEMDNVEASRVLQRLGIKEVIVQTTNGELPSEALPEKGHFGHDGIIPPKATHARRLIKEGVTQNKVFIGLPWAGHMTNNAIIAAGEEMSRL